MDVRIQIVGIIGATGLLVVILELVRRRRLLERYALLWLLAGVVLLGLAIWRGALEQLAILVGIASPPNALFFVAFGFVLVLLLHFSLVISRLADQNKVLAQRLGMVQQKLDALAGASRPMAGEPEQLPAPAHVAAPPERERDRLPAHR
jgi:hypothetical protein